MGSRGSDFKLPSVPNKMAMGGLRGLPGMPGSKGLESRGAGSKGGNKPPMAGSFKSNLGAGYKPMGGASGGPGMSSGLNAFNIPKYGSGIGGGIGGGIGLSNYQADSTAALGGIGSGSGAGFGYDNRNGSSASKRAGSRQGAGDFSGLGRHKF